jgi:hypothetical protein
MRMKVASQATLQTNAVTKSTEFKIGNEAMIVDILRNKLYSKPIQTLTQEYLSNARDAQREAGADRPVEVTLPTTDDPTLKIRDFGPGLSPARVDQVFSQYGVSTKRDSDTQTGGFGIGAKSAWAYTDAFTVVSYHDGKAYHYVVHTAKKATGTLDLIKEGETTEPNGVEIQIPIKEEDFDEFYTAVHRAVAFWTEAEFPTFTDRIDWVKRQSSHYGSDCVSVHFTEELKEFLTFETDYSPPPVICVDGIPYPCPAEFEDAVAKLKDSLQSKAVAVLYFRTGEIEVSASREAIMNTPANAKAVKARAEAAVAELNMYVLATLAKASTLRQFLTVHGALHTWYSYPDTVHFKRGSEAIGVTESGALELPASFNTLFGTRYSIHSRSERLEVGKPCSVGSFAYPINHVFWTDDETSTANQNRRVKAYLLRKRTHGKHGGSSFPDAFLICAADVNDPKLRELTEMLGSVPTSALGPAVVRNVVKVGEAADVIVNTYAGPSSKKTTAKIVNLKRATGRYVYVVRKAENATEVNSENKPLAKLVDAAGFTFCLVSEANAEKLKGSDKFLSAREFYAQIDETFAKAPGTLQLVLKGLLNSVYERGRQSMDAPGALIKLAKEINDPILRKDSPSFRRSLNSRKATGLPVPRTIWTCAK